MPCRKRNVVRATSQHLRAFAQFALAGQGVSLKGRPAIVPGTGALYGHSSGQRTPRDRGLSQEQVSPTSRVAALLLAKPAHRCLHPRC
jgi:hypothetical protein